MGNLTREYRPRRYVASVPKHAIPLDAVSIDSLDWQVSPLEECLVGRRGSIIAGDTFVNPTGLLRAKIAARCRELFEFRSDSITSGYPTYGAVYTDESDKEGVHYHFSTNGSIGYRYGQEFGSTHYPTSVGSYPDFQMVPLWCEASQLHTRCTTATQANFFCPGTRRRLTAGGVHFYPNNQGMPAMWNGRYNEATGSGTEVNRSRPWGHYPPMFPMTKGTETAATTVDAVLKDGDTFYAGVCFEMADGSFSPIFQMREKNAILTAGLGLYTIGTVGGTAKFQSVQFDDVALGPIGPVPCVARWIIGTQIQNLVSTTDALTLSFKLSDMGVIGVIRNNVQNSWIYRGNSPDAADPLRFRDDHRWPKCAQYAVAAEKRTIICGNMKQNPGAIILAPLDLSGGSPYSQNVSDTNSAMTNRFLCRLASGSPNYTLVLKYDDGAGTTTTATTITITPTFTLQDVVDTINVTTTGGGAKKWCACLVPGVDGTTLAQNLAVTTGSDFGDDAKVSDATTGNMACYVPVFPGVLYFSQAFQSALPVDVDGIEMTSAQPGAAQSQTLTFNFAGYRRPSRSLGRCLGAANITGSNSGVIALVYYERGLCALRNIKGGTSGFDEDYQLVEIGGAVGTTSWSSIGSGNGWGHDMVKDGLRVCDGDVARIISMDVWNAEALDGQGLGAWAYEIAQSAAAAASNGSGTFCFVSVLGSRIRVNYRATSASSTIANRGIVYDFSGDYPARGIAELFKADGSQYGWGCPIRQSLGAMCRITKSDGYHDYAAVEVADSVNSVGTGRIDEFNTLSDDNGTKATGIAYFRTDAHDSFTYKMGEEVDLICYNPDTTLALTHYRDVERSALSNLTVASTVTASVARIKIPFLHDGSRARFIWNELKATSDFNGGSGLPKVFGIVFRGNLLASVD